MARGAVFLFLIAAFAVGPAWAQPLKVVSETTPPQYGVTRFIVHSERVGRDFRVVVSQPAATIFLPGQKLPAIYALDGGDGIAGPEGQYLSNSWLMSAALVVSVDDAPGQGMNRLVDLAHARWTPLEGDLPETGGGGAAFEAFLLEELKPFIEARYPADPKRSVLFGHSLGALFAANVFARQPDAFNGYILASVPVWPQRDIVGRVAKAAARAGGQRIYLAVAEFDDGPNTNEMQPAFRAMTAALKGRPGVTLKTQVYPGENHSSYYGRLVLDAFPFVMPSAWDKTRSQWRLPPATLARYTGAYRMPDGREITFLIGPGQRLRAQVGSDPSVPLIQNGPDRFYAPPSDIDVVFDGAGANLSGGGAKLRIEKVR